MITMRLDAETYLRWLSELGDLWFLKGREPSVVRRRNSGVWPIVRKDAA